MAASVSGILPFCGQFQVIVPEIRNPNPRNPKEVRDPKSEKAVPFAPDWLAENIL